MKINTDPKKIEEILNRGVAVIYNKEELRELLLSGKQLHLKLGTDVTGPMIHLGHAVVQRKLRDFQELGHKVTLIIGDYTSLIGDHSDKVDMREERTIHTISEDEKTYTEQFFKTVNPELTEIRHNSEWLGKLSFNDVIHLAKQFTVAQMIERENFKLRFDAGKPIKVSEFLYPMMQGFDSVELNCDVEFGGTDQTFNILAGRHLMEVFGQKPQIGFTVKLLTGNDGRKMGKSFKNFIPVMAENNEMYSMLMQIVDDVIVEYFELITRIPMEEVNEIAEKIKAGENPMQFKKRLAFEVVNFYHGEEKAKQAQEEFERIVQNKDFSQIEETFDLKQPMNIIDLIIATNFAQSKSEARRLVEQKAVSLNGKIIESFDYSVQEEGLFRVGKKKFVNLKK
jgi:tyrosyl-tRNA synthetase